MSFLSLVLFAVDNGPAIGVGVGAVGAGGGVAYAAANKSASTTNAVIAAVTQIVKDHPKDVLDLGVKAYELANDGVQSIVAAATARQARQAAVVSQQTGLPLWTSTALITKRLEANHLLSLGLQKDKP